MGTRTLAKLNVVSWIEAFYSHKRTHSSTGYKMPVEPEGQPGLPI